MANQNCCNLLNLVISVGIEPMSKFSEARYARSDFISRRSVGNADPLSKFCSRSKRISLESCDRIVGSVPVTVFEYRSILSNSTNVLSSSGKVPRRLLLAIGRSAEDDEICQETKELIEVILQRKLTQFDSCYHIWIPPQTVNSKP